MTASRYFGPIDGNSSALDGSITVGDERVRIDLSLAAPEKLTAPDAATVDRMVDEAARIDAFARATLAAALPDDEQEPAKFWQFHHDEVEGYQALERAKLVDALALKRIGFYPDGAYGAKYFMVLDYVLRGPVTDQLLVVKLARDESLHSIAWES